MGKTIAADLQYRTFAALINTPVRRYIAEYSELPSSSILSLPALPLSPSIRRQTYTHTHIIYIYTYIVYVRICEQANANWYLFWSKLALSLSGLSFQSNLLVTTCLSMFGFSMYVRAPETSDVVNLVS